MLVSKNRIVNERPFIVSGKKLGKENFDETNCFQTFLESEIDYVTASGNPEILHLDFQIEGKSYLKLDLPIIPFVYNEREEKFLNVMIKTGDPVLVRDIYKQVKNDKTKKSKFGECITLQASTLNNFIRHELAAVYMKAVKAGNTKLMNLVSNLNIMEDVDLSPENITQTNKTNSKKMYLAQTLTSDKAYGFYLQPKNPPEDYQGKNMFQGDDKDYIDYKDKLHPLQLEALEKYKNAKSFDSPNDYTEEELLSMQ